jgi:hypothetical protein
MASPAAVPNVKTLSMSNDRRLLGKIVGHLYIARKIILEGGPCEMPEVRHEIRAMMLGRMPSGSNDNSNNESEEASSLKWWLRKVVRLLGEMNKVSDGVQGLPDDMKKDLAQLIKRGMNLCAGSSDARSQIKDAARLYKQLGGPSYL